MPQINSARLPDDFWRKHNALASLYGATFTGWLRASMRDFLNMPPVQQGLYIPDGKIFMRGGHVETSPVRIDEELYQMALRTMQLYNATHREIIIAALEARYASVHQPA